MAAALLVAAVGGGGVAVAIASLVGVGGNTTTVRIVTPEFSPPDDVSLGPTGGAMSLPAVYKRDAPGVVQVTSTATVDLPRSEWFGNSFVPGSQVQRSLGSGFVID